MTLVSLLPWYTHLLVPSPPPAVSKNALPPVPSPLLFSRTPSTRYPLTFLHLFVYSLVHLSPLEFKLHGTLFPAVASAPRTASDTWCVLNIYYLLNEKENQYLLKILP